MLAKNGRMSAPRVGRIIGELCEVLQAAHDEGIIHRDLKPANLMIVEPGHAARADQGHGLRAGQARSRARPLRKVTDTNVDFAVGTPGYICPEQVRGEEMDHRGDLYSVGVMMYELLTGRLPFQRPDEHGHPARPRHRAAADVRRAGAGRAGCRGRSRSWCSSAWRRTRSDRPQTARELAERFDTALDRAMAKLEARRRGRPRARRSKTGSSRRHAGPAAMTAQDTLAGSAAATRRSHQTPTREEARAAVPHGGVDAGADRDHEAARVRPRRRRRGGGERARADQGAARRPQGDRQRRLLVARPRPPVAARSTSNCTCSTTIRGTRTASRFTSCSARRIRGF